MTLPTSREGWAGVRVVVEGFGPEGAAAADNLLFLGAAVTVLDELAPYDDSPLGERADLLRSLGADIRLGRGTTATLPDEADLLVHTPSYEPTATLVEQAEARGVPVWSDAELAWRLRDAGAPPWLVVAEPSDGFQRATAMLALIARAAGLHAVRVGDDATPLVEAVMDPAPTDLLVVELDEAQLARSTSVRAESAVVLSGERPELARAYEGVKVACIYLAEEPATERFVMDAEVEEGARAIGLTTGTPSVSMLGVVDDILVDRAFIAERRTSAAELATLADLGPRSQGGRYVLQALAAAALARAHGLSQQAVRDGLREYGRTVDSSDDE